jgi:4-hydroxy-3-methylbut-2-en-1-yl diphosphate reductase
MKTFNIPEFYKSSFIGKIKNLRKDIDPKKKDFKPTLLDFGPVKFYMPRHFGFCYGVENAIEISYKAIEENPGKRIFLLSQMIHNPDVNADLQSRGLKFILDTYGNQLIDWDNITNDDIVVIPAFGTTLETEKILANKGIEVHKYNTTCPFVERVWKKSEKLGASDYSVIIHGKPTHEETRATFSHSQSYSSSVVIKDIEEAKLLADVILGNRTNDFFYKFFKGRYSNNFDPAVNLLKIGVVNQTTMLATETQAIADFLKQIMVQKHGNVSIKDHFADTRDTLCYATSDNQDATYGLLEQNADFAIVVGGYNSSNTTHLVELCEKKFSTYFISGEKEIISERLIRHFDYTQQKMFETNNYLPQKESPTIILTSGASCPDTVVEGVMNKILSFFKEKKSLEEVFNSLKLNSAF